MRGTAQKRYLIVNADDFGQSYGINRGIIEAHERGIVTSASLLVRGRAAVEAARYAREHLSLGLHVDLGEWELREGEWMACYEVVPIDDASAIAREVSRQLDAFVCIAGMPPTHIDSHQHVHRREPVRSILAEMAGKLAVPFREVSPGVRYRGDFYGQTAEGLSLPGAVSVERLLQILESLTPGVTELGCHPGEGEDFEGAYRTERAAEVKVLCDPQIRAAIGTLGIEFISFGDLPPA